VRTGAEVVDAEPAVGERACPAAAGVQGGARGVGHAHARVAQRFAVEPDDAAAQRRARLQADDELRPVAFVDLERSVRLAGPLGMEHVEPERAGGDVAQGERAVRRGGRPHAEQRHRGTGGAPRAQARARRRAPFQRREQRGLRQVVGVGGSAQAAREGAEPLRFGQQRRHVGHPQDLAARRRNGSGAAARRAFPGGAAGIGVRAPPRWSP
jgi:hypothetical protein